MGTNPIDAINVSATLKILSFIVLAPVIGMTISIIITLIIVNICKKSRPRVAERWFKILQVISSVGLSFAHGANDAQNVMVIIASALYAQQFTPDSENMPGWVPLSC